jgi:hypothetical protein
MTSTPRSRMTSSSRSSRQLLWVLLIGSAVGCGEERGGDRSFTDVELQEFTALMLEESDSAYVGEIYAFNTVDFSPEGRIAVGDPLTSRVLAFDPDGNLEAVAGGRGEGPGEFEQIWAVAWDPHGRLWVSDANRRVTIFSPSLDLDTILHLPEAPANTIQFPTDRALMSLSHHPREGDVITSYELEGGRPINSLLPHDTLARLPYVQSVYRAIFRVAGDSLIGGSNLSYPLHVFTLDGESIARFGAPPPSVGTMRVPERGEFAADMRRGHEWVRSFGTGSSIWVAHDTLIVVEHRRDHPDAGGIPPVFYHADVYDRRTLEKIAEDIELPGFIVGAHDDLLWILTARPPDPWTFTGYRIEVEGGG